YDSEGNHLHPYKYTDFRLVTIHPAATIASPPMIEVDGKKMPIFTPQPTIYQNQIEVVQTIDSFLAKNGIKINELNQAVEYYWKDRGLFHILPPIIEQHTYDIKDGFVDLDNLSQQFKGCYVKDAAGNLHELAKRNLDSFHIDEVSTLKRMDIFNSNAELINYGVRYSGKWSFHMICDGSHRIDYAIEVLGKPIKALLAVASTPPLLPYYAFPMPFRPTIRLSSKRAERMYPRLERDKVHLLNDFISKVLHYDWQEGGLKVSSLRTKTEIY
ncbi:MAG: hypothetical protein ACR2FM_01365, partial [Candidatus Saccharimonadales bacterium]